jgi:hypothetical protein
MKRIYLTIFLVSCAVLMLEVSLTRLFSIYFSYHFAFMVISIAMLGIGSAGTVLSLYSRKENASTGNGVSSFKTIHSRLSVFALFAGITIVLGYVVSNFMPFDPVKISWDSMQIFYVALYCAVLSVPFFFSGMLIATAFAVCSKRSEIIYGSDLLGAGAGSLFVLAILNIVGPEYPVLTASMLCFLASIMTGGKNKRIIAALLIAVDILFFVVHPEFISVRLSPYKSLPLSLKYPGSEHLKTYYNSFSRIDTLKSPAVRFAPGLSLEYLKPLPEQIGLSTDGGDMNAVTGTGNKTDMEFLEFLPSALPYEIIKSPNPPFTKGGIDVLILEPKGGLHVLLARQTLPPGGVRIYKIESNPLIVRVIREDLNEFSGGIYKENTWTGLGRSLIRGSRSFDIIDLSLTGVSPAGSFGITEDYRFTVEAFEEYFTALKGDGILSLSLYIIPPPRTELRVLGTLIEALERNGVKDVSQHIAAIRSWDSITMLMKKSPFNNEEINKIKEFSRDRRFDLVYYHGISAGETNIYVRMLSNEYFRAFESLMNHETRQPFQDNYLFSIEPVHDENPFFHYYLRLKNIKAIYEVMGHKWQYFIEEGYLLPVVFIQVSILCIILIILPVLASTRLLSPSSSPTLIYFAMLGIGFMFVEVTLIQKSILSLVNPVFAVATVLTAILVSSGTGSMISSRFRMFSTNILIVIASMILVYSLAFPYFMRHISPYSLVLKVPLVFTALVPLGFFMGFPFPAGIRLLGQNNSSVIPWAWAINGCLSVLAPIVTIMLAMVFGFKTVLWVGAMAYLIAFFALKKMQ